MANLEKFLTPAQRKYIHLLRAALWSGACDEPCDADVLGIAVRQRTEAMICSVARDSPSSAISASCCDSVILRSIWTHNRMDALVARLVTLLRGVGVDPVLLKGQGCAAFYSMPVLRSCGDIDLYVGPEDYAAACDALSQIASRGEEDYSHTQFCFHGTEVEIHRHCKDLTTLAIAGKFESYVEQGTSAGVRHLPVGGCTVSTPEDTFNALYLFFHFLHHFQHGGVGFRQICDWVMMLHARRDSIDRTRLSEMIHNLELEHSWSVFGWIAVNCLGLPVDEMPFYDAQCSSHCVKRTLRCIFRDGNFGAEESLKERARLLGQKPLRRKAVTALHLVRRFYGRRYIQPSMMPYSDFAASLLSGFRRALNQ